MARWFNYSKTISSSACSIQKMTAILRRAVEPCLEQEEEREVLELEDDRTNNPLTSLGSRL